MPQEHMLARIIIDKDSFIQEMKKTPASILRIHASSFGNQATLERLELEISEKVLPKDEYKKWLSSAKRQARKDPQLVLPTRKNEPVRIREGDSSEEDEILAEISKARNLKALLSAVERFLKKSESVTKLQPILPDVLTQLDQFIQQSRPKNPAAVLEALWVRDDLAKICESGVSKSPVKLEDLIREVHSLGEVLGNIPTHKQRLLLPLIKQHFPDWKQRLLKSIDAVNPKAVREIIAFLIKEGEGNDLKEIFRQRIQDQTASCSLLHWIVSSRTDPAFAAWVPDLINARLFSTILSSLERLAAEQGRKKNVLQEFLISDLELIPNLIENCDYEETRDLAKSLLLNPAFEELDKRSLMARIIKVCPAVQNLISGKHEKGETLLVSWESLERRKKEYDEIVHKKIPENTKEISIARSFGDLRENHEFKAAKEMQGILLRQKAELEALLVNARGTDFRDADVTSVNIGTKVKLQSKDDGRELTFKILGAWDSKPDEGVISYQSAVAQALLKKKVGEEAVLPGDKGERPVKIVEIRPAVEA
jgi:transcription elongation GreA/GreB family factor